MQRFKIISKKEGTAPANVTKELSLCHIALDYFVDDLSKPDVQRIDLGAAELCRTGLVAGTRVPP